MHSKIIIFKSKIQKNWNLINKKSNFKASAVVKANGYGFGMEEVSKSLIEKGCNFFYLAQFEEAIKFKKNLNSKKIKVAVFEGMIHKPIDYVKNDIIPILNNTNQLNKLNKFNSQNPHKNLNAILNIDTGMNRLGFDEKEILHIQSEKKIINSKNIIFLMSHLSHSNIPKSLINKSQLNKIKKFSLHFKDIKLSLSNTNGILLGEEFVLDQTRPGIGIFGLDANGQEIIINNTKLEIPFILKCPIIQIRNVKKNETISYEGITKLTKDSIIATIGIGYADGIFRMFKKNLSIKIKDIDCKVVGNITMDSFMIDISDIDENYLKVGDYIEIINSENLLSILLKNPDLNIYEIFTHLSDRIVKIYD